MTKPKSHALIVLGMHRSGTSAITGVLHRLGVTLGPKLYRGHAGINDKGYFEHADIADTNNNALLLLGSSWDDILPLENDWWQDPRLKPLAIKQRKYLRRDFSNTLLWAIKDPRVCRLLPWWQHCILEPEGVDARYLLIVRDPLEVTNSLMRRDGFSERKSMLLWLEHNLQAEYWTRNHMRTCLAFDLLLADPENSLNQIEKDLKLSFSISIANALPSIKTFLNADLRHHRQSKQPKELETLADLAYQLYQVMGGADKSWLNLNLNDYFLESFKKNRLKDQSVLIEHLKSVSLQNGNSRFLIQKIFRSHAWQLGKPFRFIERMLGGEA
ncbi:sulfotransferase family protein [Allochromatium palmeri]|uniref:Sulfotransferase family protein n=1 Tax=Allochromatium palmeri TaxID=231048 RepID=A0A6N8EAL1_9GAMM|nr:hypothetical protein [Allochromatium palmeri]MTW21195.1 hypothetical protein [Allochromatium palmeri]